MYEFKLCCLSLIGLLGDCSYLGIKTGPCTKPIQNKTLFPASESFFSELVSSTKYWGNRVTQGVSISPSMRCSKEAGSVGRQGLCYWP